MTRLEGDTDAPLAERWGRYVLLPDIWQVNGCWEWIGWKNCAGYGSIDSGAPDFKTLEAHRVSWELANGPIPAGLTIDHLCCNPGCQNPWHMEPVTKAENSHRASVWTDPLLLRCGHTNTPTNTRVTKGRNRRTYLKCRECERATLRRRFARRKIEPLEYSGNTCIRGHVIGPDNYTVDGRCRTCARLLGKEGARRRRALNS